MVPRLPDSSWEFDDTFRRSEAAGPLVFSTNVTLEAFSVKRLPGSRTVRDLMITSGKGSLSKAPSHCPCSVSALVQEQRVPTGRFLWWTLFLRSLSSGVVVLFGVFPAVSRLQTSRSRLLA